MVELRKNVQVPGGGQIEGTVVGITEAIERFSELKLEDGTILKTKPVVVEAIRLDDQWDNDGNPVYVLKTQNMVAVSEAREELRKKVQ